MRSPLGIGFLKFKTKCKGITIAYYFNIPKSIN